MLQILGVIRIRQNVEFWCADDPLETSPVMKELLGEADSMMRVMKDACFQIVVGGLPPCVYKWKSLASAILFFPCLFVQASQMFCIIV